MKIVKTKIFTKWALKNEVTDETLATAAKEIVIDVYEANYGGGVVKKRIANKRRGKRSSTRTIVAFNEEKAFKIIAKSLLASSDFEINELIKEGVLVEVKNE